MKIAEKLKIRKVYFEALENIDSRILSNCVVQEGDTLAENADEMVTKASQTLRN